MGIISKIRDKLSYTKVAPMNYTQELSDAYNGVSVVNGEHKGHTVAVTGATGGIGFAIAKRFVLEGSNVILIGRNSEKLEIAKQTLLALGRNVKVDATPMDMLSYDDVVSKTKSLLDKSLIDVWVNCAGILKKKDRHPAFRSYPKKDILDVLNTNLKSCYVITKLIADEVKDSSSKCTIVNISSICGYSKKHGYTGYGMSKAGAIKMTKVLAQQYADQNLSIVSIAPGSVATNMGDRHFGDNIGVNVSAITKHISMSEEIAALTAFVSGRMSSVLSGETIIASADEVL